MADGTIPLWSDNPAHLDLLGFADIAAPVLEVVQRDKLDPVAVGVFGPWGSGKTTILGLIREELANTPSVIVVDTRPWEYESFVDVRSTLIGEVLGRLQEVGRDENGVLGKVGAGLAKLVARVDWTKALSLAASTALTLNVAGLASIGDIFKTDDGQELSLAGFRTEFAEFMESAEGVSRVVVLVDDLDRCLPSAVIATLEAVKLFLSVPKMAFVVAADQESVVHAISQLYQSSPTAQTMAQEYLEKIVQIPVRVPSLGLGDTEAYLALMLLEHRLGEDPVYSQLVAVCNERRATSKPVILEFDDKKLPAGANADLQLARLLAPVLYGELKGNPRRVKRFLNAYWIRYSIAQRRDVSLEPSALAKLMVLEELHPREFRTIVAWSLESSLASRLNLLESEPKDGPERDEDASPDAAPQALREWARMEPHLAEVDLGPYLRLAASLMTVPTAPPGLRADLAEVFAGLISSSDTTRKQAQKDSAKLSPEDRLELLDQVTSRLVLRPEEQDRLGQSIVSLVRGNEAAAEMAAGKLQELEITRLESSLCVRLLPRSNRLASFVSLAEDWRDTEGIPDEAKHAIESLLPKRNQG